MMTRSWNQATINSSLRKLGGMCSLVLLIMFKASFKMNTMVVTSEVQDVDSFLHSAPCVSSNPFCFPFCYFHFSLSLSLVLALARWRMRKTCEESRKSLLRRKKGNPVARGYSGRKNYQDQIFSRICSLQFYFHHICHIFNFIYCSFLKPHKAHLPLSTTVSLQAIVQHHFAICRMRLFFPAAI